MSLATDPQTSQPPRRIAPFVSMLAAMTLGALLASATAESTNAQTVKARSAMPRLDAGYPVDLHLCKLDDDLQRCLDANTRIRLEIGDYTRGQIGPLRVRSDQQIFGLPGTTVPEIVIDAGTERAVLSALAADKVIFSRATGDKPIRLNQFIRVNAAFESIGAAVDNNLFIYCNGPLSVDTSASGYLRNNRFIGSHAHGPSDMIHIEGDSKRQSFGNTFLWYNFLTSRGRTSHISNQNSITFVGIDAESWNFDGEDKDWTPMLDLDKTSLLRVLMAGGGNMRPYPTPYLRANVDTIQILDIDVAKNASGDNPRDHAGNPWIKDNVNHVNNFLIGSANKLSWISHSCCDNPVAYAIPNGHFELIRRPRSGLMANNAVLSPSQPAPDMAPFHGLFTAANSAAAPWEPPSFAPPVDPAGPNWSDLVKKAAQDGTDDTARIQKMIDDSRDGVAFLPAGIFFISRPLVVGANKGIIGAGTGKTAILALSGGLDMIVTADPGHPNKGRLQRFILSDLTMQGGRNGLFHSGATTGPFLQLHDVFLSHVQFRDMAESGVKFEGIYGWDNDLIDNVTFKNCNTGFKQIYTRIKLPGERSDANYIDKVLFYNAQFIENNIGADLQANRQNNLNAFIYTLFADNKQGAVRMNDTDRTLFARSELSNNGGDSVIEMRNSGHVALVGSRVVAGKNGKAFFSHGVTAEGTTFQQGAEGRATLFKPGAEGIQIYNSSSDVPKGEIAQGIFINSIFPDAGFDRFLTIQLDRSNVIGNGGPSNPQEQLLLGAPQPVAAATQ